MTYGIGARDLKVDYLKGKRYRSIPSTQQWVSLSYEHRNVIFIRYLTRAIEDYWASVNRARMKGGRFRVDILFTLYDIYSSTSEWLRSMTDNRMLNRMDRELMGEISPLVDALNWAATHELLSRLGAENDRVLKIKLEDIFGVGMTGHGSDCDTEAMKLKPFEYGFGAKYLSLSALQKYRVYFRYNKAYRISEGGQAIELDTDNSLSGYAFTLDNVLYVSEDHEIATDQREGFFHSAYTSGDPVLCAGMIAFKDGLPTLINNDSGHYMPRALQLKLVLNHFMRKGVNIADTSVTAIDIMKKGDEKKKIFPKPPPVYCKAPEFLSLDLSQYPLRG